MRNVLALTISLGAVGLASPAIGANVTKVRIASHSDHVRVVLDLDDAAAYTQSEDGSFILKGVAGDNAIQNAAQTDAPLKRVMITSGDDGLAHLKFETSGPVTAKAFMLTPDREGGHRLVVDLFPKMESTATATAVEKTEKTESPKPAIVGVEGAKSMAAVAEMAALDITPKATGAPTAILSHAPAVRAAAIGVSAATNSVAALPASSPPLPAPFNPAPPHIAGSGYSTAAFDAERALDRGDFAKACEAADAAVKANITDLRAMAIQGDCRLSKHDGTGAKAIFSAALELDPGFDRARIGLATAEDMLGDQSGARNELAKVLGHDLPEAERGRLIEALRALQNARKAQVSAR